MQKNKDIGTSFESQESCRMIKVKVGYENFSFEVFTEDTVDASFYYERIYWSLMPQNNTNHEWLSENSFFPDDVKKMLK